MIRSLNACRKFASAMCASPLSQNRSFSIGVELSPRRHQDELALDAFLGYIEVLDFPDETASHYAKIRAHLKTRGRMIGANDLLMAAHARSLGLTLVTNNTHEFGRVQNLVIENWGSHRLGSSSAFNSAMTAALIGWRG